MREIVVNGKKVRELREELRLTQGQLALKSGVGQSHISHLEAGKRSNIHIATASKLAEALGIEIDDLLLNPRPRSNGLPDFRAYVVRKFKDNPRLQKALLATYEALTA